MELIDFIQTESLETQSLDVLLTDLSTQVSYENLKIFVKLYRAGLY